jgi:uncharacterized protein (TIGR02246 family)
LRDDRRVPTSEPLDLVRSLLHDLQTAMRDRDLAAALDLFTDGAALLGTSATNLGRQPVDEYLSALVLEPTGYPLWDWETVSVTDSRPGAVTFIALGTVGWADDPADDTRTPMRLTCLLLEDADRWRIGLFHGSVLSV